MTIFTLHFGTGIGIVFFGTYRTFFADRRHCSCNYILNYFISKKKYKVFQFLGAVPSVPYDPYKHSHYIIMSCQINVIMYLH